ncbi:MAG: hypothetical protein FWF10_01795 [Clostridiales bacterium]|nr:hypothetical protein [Clostridiales bacterium]
MRRIWTGILACLLLLLLLPGAARAEEENPVIRSLKTDGALVYIDAWGYSPVTAYAFSTIEAAPAQDATDWRPYKGSHMPVYKWDGDYFVRVMDAEGRISEAERVTVASGYTYVLEAEGQDYLREPIEKFLEKNGDSMETFNRYLARQAERAGLFTPAAVALVSVGFLSRMAQYDMTLAYQAHGNYTRAGDWGLAPGWGAKLSKPDMDNSNKQAYLYGAMNCGTIIMWAYKQAGLNLSGTGGRDGIGDTGHRVRRGDNKIKLDNGDTGDLISTKTGHFILILDRVDTDMDGAADSYLVFEMESPYLKLKCRSFRSVRGCTFWDMSAVFDGSGAYKRLSAYWPGQFTVPVEEFPEYYVKTHRQHNAGYRKGMRYRIIHLY